MSEQKQPTALDALGVLDQATLPSNAGKLNRADYANIQRALQIIAEFIDANSPKVDAKIPNSPKKT